jgi:hypothetical protein
MYIFLRVNKSDMFPRRKSTNSREAKTKIPNAREEKPDRNSDAASEIASGTMLRISECFQRNEQKISIYFSLGKRQPERLKSWY